MVYRGHVQNGVVVLDEMPSLPEGAEVRVAVVPPASEQFNSGLAANEIRGQTRRASARSGAQSRSLCAWSAKEVKEVFADTAYYLALLNARDELHERAAAVTEALLGVKE